MTSEPTARRVWQGIECADPPPIRHDFRQLLKMVEAMLAARVNGFPQKIAAGEITDAEARAEIMLFENMRADWRFIASGGVDGEPAHPATITARRRALDQSIAKIADIARQNGGEFTNSLSAKAEAVIALRWHLEPGRDTVALARLTQQLRARAKRDAAANTSRKAAA